MKMLNKLIYILGLLALLTIPSCTEPDAEIYNIEFDRLFSPVKFEAKVVNKTSVRLTWSESRKADSYTVELFQNGNLSFEGTPIRSYANVTEIPYVIEGLDGETDYSVRVKAVSSEIAESKWSTAKFKTDAEQIFNTIGEDDLKATEVTLRWPKGQVATEVVLTPGNIKHTVTAKEIADGAVTITGLTGETQYTAKLMNGTKTRGTVTFTTLIDLGGAKGVYPGDDLVAIMNAAQDGDAFVLFPGDYIIGDYALTKSITLTGYKSSNKPVIYGRFVCGATVGSLNLKSVILDGSIKIQGEAQKANVFEVASGCNISAVNILDSEIRNYVRAIFYNNTASTVLGDLKISGCIVSNITGDGGDGIDIRTGSLTSLIVENTTFNTGFRSFLRVAITSNITIRSCTFYNICTVDNKDNSGLFRSSGGGTFSVSKCIIVGVGIANPTNASVGNWCKAGNMKATATYSNNYYYNCPNLWVGEYTKASDCGATEANPQFQNAATGDFTVNNIDIEVGDPRWLK